MDSKDHKTNKDWMPATSLYLGVASIFLWEFSIIPILAVIFGVLVLLGSDEKKWKAWAGVALGVVFLVVRISHGYVDRGLVNTASGGDTYEAPSTIQYIQTENLQQKINTIWSKGETVDQAIQNGEIRSFDRNEAQLLYQKKWDTVCLGLKESIRLYGPAHMPILEGCN